MWADVCFLFRDNSKINDQWILDRRTSYLRIMGLVSRRDGLREDDLRFPDDCEPHNLGPSCCRVLAAEFMNYEIADGNDSTVKMLHEGSQRFGASTFIMW